MYINRRIQDPWVDEEGRLLQHKQRPEQHYVLVPWPQSPHGDVMRVRCYLCTQWGYITRKEPQISKLWATRNCWALLPFSLLGRERFIILESKQMSLGRKANVPGVSQARHFPKSLQMIALSVASRLLAPHSCPSLGRLRPGRKARNPGRIVSQHFQLFNNWVEFDVFLFKKKLRFP